MDFPDMPEDEDKFFDELDELLGELSFKDSDSFEFVNVIKNYSDVEFKRNFRLKRSTVFDIITGYQLYNLQKKKKYIDAELEIYIYFWYLCSELTTSEIGSLFRVERINVLKPLSRVSKFIMDEYSELVQWPIHEVCAKNSIIFERLTKIPNVIGIMNVMHVRIKTPKYDSASYLNGQRFSSITAQVIVDANMKFIDVYCNEPGSLADDRILRESPVYVNIMQNMGYYFPPNTFILGQCDKYPITPWLVSPINEAGSKLSMFEKQFNHLHYGASKLAKDTVDQVMFRFRKLLNFNDFLHIKLLTNIICTAFVLHNMCIIKNDSVSECMSNPFEEWNAIESSRRQLLIEELSFKNIISKN